MATHSGKKTLSATTQILQLKIPNPLLKYACVLCLKGTYVGQIQVESRDLDGAWNGDVIDEDSGVAIDGTYTNQAEPDVEVMVAGLIPAGEDEVRCFLSAYTSGSVEAQLTLVPDLD